MHELHTAPLAIKFLKEACQTPNKLLKAVLTDLSVPKYIRGCKVLGIIDKIINGSLWRVLECKDVSIFDINEHF